MNKLSCASALLTLAREDLAVASPVAHRQRLRIRVPAGTESSDEGTTPEAHTDGDNDSAFDSDDDEKHGLPAPRCLHPRSPNPLSGSYRWSCTRKPSVRQRALPRKQLGNLPSRASPTRLAPVPNPWSDVQRSLARQALAPIGSVGEINSSNPPSFQLDYKADSFKAERRQVASAKMRAREIHAAAKPGLPSPTLQGCEGLGKTLGIGRKLSAGNENSITCLAGESPRRVSRKMLASPCPSKKRRMGTVSGLPPPQRRDPEHGQSASNEDKQAAHVNPVVKSAKPSPALGDGTGCSESDTNIDLSCNEVIDMDEVMCGGDAEARTPICRFLIPSWPEGVEGYEEVGGWRRLGGSATPELFPKGERHD